MPSTEVAVTVARTILNQIGSSTLMCIGFHKPIIVPACSEHDGGVTFKINPNPKLKMHGKVTITLAFNDTYNVKIETCKGKVVYDEKGIYNDMLAGPSGVIERVTG